MGIIERKQQNEGGGGEGGEGVGINDTGYPLICFVLGLNGAKGRERKKRKKSKGEGKGMKNKKNFSLTWRSWRIEERDVVHRYLGRGLLYQKERGKMTVGGKRSYSSVEGD